MEELNKLKHLYIGQRTTLDEAHQAVLRSCQGAVWFHAASVGEFEQARPIIERLVESQTSKVKGERLPIVVTFFSPSGYEARKNYPQADGVFYLPLPTRRNAKKFLDALQPKMAIFVKYEFWPAFLKELKKRAIPTYSICAIFREKQYMFHWWGAWMLKVLRCFTHIFVQDEASKTLLNAHGIEACSVAGDTRFDRMMAVRQERLQHTAQTNRFTPIAAFVEGCEQVIVAGSTWPKDEILLERYMNKCRQLSANGQQPKLILVPHEIDEAHLHFIFNLFKGRMVRYSNVQATKDSIRHILHQANVLVVDAMGLLSSIYPYGQVAYIGGGFGVGIHNTIEAAAYGKPVLFGPNYHHFREAKGLIEAGAARSISNYAELESALDDALNHYIEQGAKAALYVQSELGTTERIFKEIF